MYALEDSFVTIGIVVVATLIAAILLGIFKPAWAGVRGKTAWDWITLLLVPTTLGFATLLLSAAQQSIDRNRQQEAALQDYVGRISDLILTGDKDAPHVEAVARAQTAAILALLSGERSGRIILFLDEVGLLKAAVRSLENADLSKAELKGLDLSGLEFEGANLRGADLEDSILRGADFEETDLRGTDLDGADLREVDFKDADMRGVEMAGADLRGADLSAATGLSADALEDACYDPSTKLPAGFSPATGETPGCSEDRDRDTD